MFIDTVALVLLVIAVFKGFTKGFIVALFSFLAFIIGLAAALKLSALAAEYIGNAVSISQRWLPVIAFLVVFLIVAIAIRLGAKMLEGAVKLAMLGWLNRLGGIIFYILIYFFIFSILLFYAGQLHFIKPETVESSVTYPWIQPIAPKIMAVMGAIMPFFKDMFDQLLQFFENVSTHKS